MSNAGSRDAIPDVGSSLDDFITAYVAAWNFHDAGRLLAFFHPDATYEDSVWPVTMHGHGDIQKLLTAAWRAFPDMHFELVEGPYRLGQSKAALWWRASGTMTGPLDPPGYAATGRSWEFDGVDFMEYRDGRIITLRVIFDVADAARQAGLIPQLGSRLGKITVRAQRLSVKVLPGSPAANPAAGILPEKANQQATPAVHRFVRRLAATEIGSWVFARTLHHVDRVAFRISGRRHTFTAAVSGLPVIMLTTTGARTGMPRTVPVLGFPMGLDNGSDIVVAAGNFGRRQEPAWSINLRLEPRARVVIGGSARDVVAEELTGDDREQAWQSGLAIYPGGGAYARRAGTRTIRMFRLRASDA